MAVPDSKIPQLEQSKYNFTSRVFPLDLTMEDNNHYMVININVPTYAPFGVLRDSRTGTGAPLRTSFPGPYAGAGMEPIRNVSKVDNLRFNPANVNLSPGDPGIGSELLLEGMRWTTRIAESIALHMPQSGLVYTEDNKYQEISMTALAGDAISAVASGVGKAIAGKAGAEAAQSLVDAAGGVLSFLQKSGTALGMPIVPRVQVLFATRPQRQWVFEVFMMPRSEEESKAVKEIIKTLRFYAAPELDAVTRGFTFIPPAEFDITFYRGGNENLNLPRINTCVLERIDLDYAPQGDYSVFDKDGHSVAVRMSLSFRETEILHKRRIYEGF